MANRILRDWTTSDKMELLSLGAEVFFTRLIMKADDYGSFHANPKLLKAALFPLKEYSLKQVDGWLQECIQNKLIGSYEVEGKTYIRIINFGQRLQNMRNAFPAPLCGLNELTVIHGESPPETKRNEEETESETIVCVVWPSFDDFWDKYDKKVGRPKSEALWKKIDQGGREKIMHHLDDYIKTEKQYRKDPERYLKNESWNDEIVKQNGNGNSKTGSGGVGVTEQGTRQRVNGYDNS